MTLKEKTGVEVDMEEPQKVNAGSGELRTTEAAGASKDGHPVSMKVGLGKVEDQSRKANAGTEGLIGGTGKKEVEAGWGRKVVNHTVQ